MSSQIRLENINKSFIGEGIVTKALESINLTLHKGELISIVGSSGSGKSTLLSLIGTLDKPTEGSIYFDDINVSSLKGNKLADFRFQNIGFIFQQFHLLPTLTALENVATPLFGRKVSFNKNKKAKELLEQVGLADKINSLPSQLSGGQQQRVAIARALINEPSWLLADEPTGNLDSKTGQKIFDLINELKNNTKCGVLFVTHDPRLAQKADRIIEMQDGHIVPIHRVS